ncbi:hypothetical protein ACTXT7_008516 [Hymenolepis weldensis]
MGANTSKDEIFRNEIGCDTIGTVPCNDSTTLFCLEGECALYVADFEKKCVEGCKRRLNREWEQQYNNPSGAVNSRTAGNQRNEVEMELSGSLGET